MLSLICIPPEWPLPKILDQLIQKSLGQFIYTSTIIHYVSSIQHKPTDFLDIILGICPPQRDLPFAKLDALYAHIFTGMEDIEHALEILGLVLFSPNPLYYYSNSLVMIERFLSLETGDVKLYLGDLSSLMNIGSDQKVNILHASLTDFLMDPTCLKELWLNPLA